MSQKNKSHLLNKLWCNAHLLLILAALFWAGHAIVLRMSVGEISPILLMELRWLCSFLILATIFRGKILSYLDQAVKNWRWIMIMGGVGLAGFTILLVYAAQYTTAMNLGIMQAAMPAFVLIFGFLFFSNSINARQCLGFFVSLLGVVVLISEGQLKILLKLSFNLGDLIMLAACFCYSGYTVHLSKKIDIPPMILLCFFSFCALVTCSIFAVIEYSRGLTVYPDFGGVILVAYCAIFPSILSQTFFIRGVQIVGASRAGFYVNLVPVFSAFLAIIILSETMYLYHILALGGVILGIFLSDNEAKK